MQHLAAWQRGLWIPPIADSVFGFRPTVTAVEDSETATVPRLELTLGELAKTLVTTSQYGTLCSTLPIREDEEGVHRQLLLPRTRAKPPLANPSDLSPPLSRTALRRAGRAPGAPQRGSLRHHQYAGGAGTR